MRTIIFSFMMLACLSVTAQSSITVTHTVGKVYYYGPQETTARAIYPGLSLSPDGKIQCASKSKVTLLCNGKTFEFEDTQMHFLDGIAREAAKTSRLSFMSRFWGFLTGSMEGTEDELHLEEHHKKSMENLHAGIKGYASKEFPIQTGLIYEGNLSDKPVLFSWSAPDQQSCMFRLSRQTDDVVILSTWTKAQMLTLNLADLPLEAGGQYEWQIVCNENDPASTRSRKMQFTYQPQKAEKALAAARDQDGYKTASAVEQALMEAFALEEQKFFYDADQHYTALRQKYPDDVLVKRACAAFMARMDQLDAAKTIIK